MHRGSPNERLYAYADSSEVTLASSSHVSTAVADVSLPIMLSTLTALVEASSVESLDSSESLSLCSSSSNCSLGSPLPFRSSEELAHYKEAEPLCGSVPEYERHVFLCYREKTPGDVLDRCAWDEMPKSLGSAVKKWSDQLRKKVMLTVCQGDCDSDLFDGTVMLFPDMLEYRSLTRFDVKLFVQEALVEERNFKLKPRKLQGTHVFICCDPALGSPCASQGPDLYKKFKDAVDKDRLNDRVKVWKTSSFFNHKEPGNVIIFRHRSDGGVDGDWYGMVKSSDVPKLLREHIERGNILEHLWRGRMGMDEEQQREEREQRMRSRLEMYKCRPDSGIPLIGGVPLKSVDCLRKCADGRYGDSPDGDDARCLSESSSCSGREEELSVKRWAARESEKVFGLVRQNRCHYALVDGKVVLDSFVKRGGESPLLGERPRPPPVPPCRSGGSWNRSMMSACRSSRMGTGSLNCSPNSSCGGGSGGATGKGGFGATNCGISPAGFRPAAGSGCAWRRSASAPAGRSQRHSSNQYRQQQSPSSSPSSASASSSSASSSLLGGSKYLSSFLRSNCRLEWESLDTIGVTSLAIAVFSTAVAFQAVGSLMSSSSCCSQQ
ncbi:hypothetical protein CBR_g30476 [Chara braunii]|uniref:Uncharacterized protein n=1 Tax=Chara braunii TaxID=69332 RepID=A0A388LCR9_CHABU|nr:hypothetical protein CBR_g30476 [Chara braunii]|eukprot:GBG80109.1 hypothetical protein CBR_g30476 [Chara braunii]